MITEQTFNRIKPEIKEILKKALKSEEITAEEDLELLKVTGKEFLALQYVANQICFEKKEDIVTFVINRNINFTNICYQKCKFCSFSIPADHVDSFLLGVDFHRCRNQVVVHDVVDGEGCQALVEGSAFFFECLGRKVAEESRYFNYVFTGDGRQPDVEVVGDRPAVAVFFCDECR